MVGKPRDLTGQQFGRLTVVRLSPVRKRNTKPYWECNCICGATTTVRSDMLVGGRTTGCGCMGGPTAGQFVALPDGRASLHFIIREYRKGAARRGIGWHLSDKEAEDLLVRPCYYCGAEPTRSIPKRSSASLYGGIDRLEPGAGYIAGNCVPCCRTCNIAKHDMTRTEFVFWVMRVHAHLTREDG